MSRFSSSMGAAPGRGGTLRRTMSRGGGFPIEAVVSSGLNGTMCEDDFVAVVLGGFMQSLDKQSQDWCLRYFFLEDDFLNEYRQEMDHHLNKLPVRQIRVRGATVSALCAAMYGGENDRPYVFQVTEQNGHISHVFAVSSRDDRNFWWELMSDAGAVLDAAARVAFEEVDIAMELALQDDAAAAHPDKDMRDAASPEPQPLETAVKLTLAPAQEDVTEGEHARDYVRTNEREQNTVEAEAASLQEGRKNVASLAPSSPSKLSSLPASQSSLPAVDVSGGRKLPSAAASTTTTTASAAATAASTGASTLARQMCLLVERGTLRKRPAPTHNPQNINANFTLNNPKNTSAATTTKSSLLSPADASTNATVAAAPVASNHMVPVSNPLPPVPPASSGVTPRALTSAGAGTIRRNMLVGNFNVAPAALPYLSAAPAPLSTLPTCLAPVSPISAAVSSVPACVVATAVVLPAPSSSYSLQSNSHNSAELTQGGALLQQGVLVSAASTVADRTAVSITAVAAAPSAPTTTLAATPAAAASTASTIETFLPSMAPHFSVAAIAYPTLRPARAQQKSSSSNTIISSSAPGAATPTLLPSFIPSLPSSPTPLPEKPAPQQQAFIETAARRVAAGEDLPVWAPSPSCNAANASPSPSPSPSPVPLYLGLQHPFLAPTPAPSLSQPSKQLQQSVLEPASSGSNMFVNSNHPSLSRSSNDTRVVGHALDFNDDDRDFLGNVSVFQSSDDDDDEEEEGEVGGRERALGNDVLSQGDEFEEEEESEGDEEMEGGLAPIIEVRDGEQQWRGRESKQGERMKSATSPVSLASPSRATKQAEWGEGEESIPTDDRLFAVPSGNTSGSNSNNNNTALSLSPSGFSPLPSRTRTPLVPIAVHAPHAAHARGRASSVPLAPGSGDSNNSSSSNLSSGGSSSTHTSQWLAAVPADGGRIEGMGNTVCGYLVKQGGRVRNWKRRYFALVFGTLSYYRVESSARELGRLRVADARLTALPSGYGGRSKGCLFSVVPKASQRTYLLQAPDENDRRRWMLALRDAGAIIDLYASSSSEHRDGKLRARAATALDRSVGTGPSLQSSVSFVSAGEQRLVSKGLSLVRSLAKRRANPKRLCDYKGMTFSESYLHKLGGEVHNWKRRLFRLMAPVLSAQQTIAPAVAEATSEEGGGARILYFKSHTSDKVKGEIPLTGCCIFLYPSNSFAGRSGVLLGLRPVGEVRTYVLEFPGAALRLEWVRAVQQLGGYLHQAGGAENGSAAGDKAKQLSSSRGLRVLKGLFTRRGSNAQAPAATSSTPPKSGNAHPRDPGRDEDESSSKRRKSPHSNSVSHEGLVVHSADVSAEGSEKRLSIHAPRLYEDGESHKCGNRSIFATNTTNGKQGEENLNSSNLFIGKENNTSLIFDFNHIESIIVAPVTHSKVSKLGHTTLSINKAGEAVGALGNAVVEESFHAVDPEKLLGGMDDTAADDDVNMTAQRLPSFNGFLWKLGGKIKNWKHRFFSLADYELSYFSSNTTDAEKLGSIEVQCATVYPLPPNSHGRKSDFLFAVSPDGGSRTYVLSAASEAVRAAWLEALEGNGAFLKSAQEAELSQQRRRKGSGSVLTPVRGSLRRGSALFKKAAKRLSLSAAKAPKDVRESREAEACGVCKEAFGLRKWKYSCPRCSRSVCGACSERKVTHRKPCEKDEMTRVCTDCFEAVSTTAGSSKTHTTMARDRDIMRVSASVPGISALLNSEVQNDESIVYVQEKDNDMDAQAANNASNSLSNSLSGGSDNRGMIAFE